MNHTTRSTSITARLGALLLGLLSAGALQACGPLAIGAIAASGGGGGGGDGTSTVNFTESEPNDTAPGNFVGSIFPGRTYIVSGAHPPGINDTDFFRIDATQPVRVQITLTPSGLADLVMFVGFPVDNGRGGVAETFVADMNTNDMFAIGSQEFNDLAASYTLRLVGQALPSPLQDGPAPPVASAHTTYLHLDADGRVLFRLDVTDSQSPGTGLTAASPAEPGE